MDGDDGTIDGAGKAGGSFYSNGELTRTFSFDADTLGLFPTEAGIVWTDVGSGGGLNSPFTFEAFGPDGRTLGMIGPILLGDGRDDGTTAEDRFFGAFNTAGISAIAITSDNDDWEVDHLQYGFGANPTAVEGATWGRVKSLYR